MSRLAVLPLRGTARAVRRSWSCFLYLRFCLRPVWRTEQVSHPLSLLPSGLLPVFPALRFQTLPKDHGNSESHLTNQFQGRHCRILVPKPCAGCVLAATDAFSQAEIVLLLYKRVGGPAHQVAQSPERPHLLVSQGAGAKPMQAELSRQGLTHSGDRITHVNGNQQMIRRE